MKMRALLILALAAPLAAHAEPELKGSPTELEAYLEGPKQKVTIQGTAETKVPAERATVRLLIKTEDDSLSDSLKKNQKVRGEIADEIEKAGIRAGAIHGARFASTPQRGWLTDKIRNYTVENEIQIAVTNEVEYQAVAAVLDDHKEAAFGGVKFEVQRPLDHKRNALRDACTAVSEKAKVFEETLGVKLKPVTFTENTSGPGQPVPYAAGMKASANIAQVYDEYSPGPSQFDELVFNATVTVTYEVVTP
jgi:uncharacterized protein YggE